MLFRSERINSTITRSIQERINDKIRFYINPINVPIVHLKKKPNAFSRNNGINKMPIDYFNKTILSNMKWNINLNTQRRCMKFPGEFRQNAPFINNIIISQVACLTIFSLL